MKRIIFGLCIVMSALIATGGGSSAALQGELTITVFDRALDTPLPDVDIRVLQKGVEKATGVTGANGSVTFRGLAAGDARVSGALDGYIRRPETEDATVRAGANVPVRLTLLAESQKTDYFVLVGKQIESEAAKLPDAGKDAFFKREWDRVKLLRFEFQMPVFSEIKSGKVYLANDSSFQVLMKGGKIGG